MRDGSSCYQWSASLSLPGTSDGPSRSACLSLAVLQQPWHCFVCLACVVSALLTQQQQPVASPSPSPNIFGARSWFVLHYSTSSGCRSQNQLLAVLYFRWGVNAPPPPERWHMIRTDPSSSCSSLGSIGMQIECRPPVSAAAAPPLSPLSPPPTQTRLTCTSALLWCGADISPGRGSPHVFVSSLHRCCVVCEAAIKARLCLPLPFLPCVTSPSCFSFLPLPLFFSPPTSHQ